MAETGRAGGSRGDRGAGTGRARKAQAIPLDPSRLGEIMADVEAFARPPKGKAVNRDAERTVVQALLKKNATIEQIREFCKAHGFTVSEAFVTLCRREISGSSGGVEVPAPPPPPARQTPRRKAGEDEV